MSGTSLMGKLFDAGKKYATDFWESTDPNKRPEGGDLSTFIATVKDKGLARTSAFVVTMNTPLSLNTEKRKEALQTENYMEMLALFCKTAELPGLNFDTTEINSLYTISAPYNKTHTDLQLTFYVDSKMDTKKFFDHWMDSIQLTSTKGFEFYKNFTADIMVDVFNLEENKVYSVKMFEAFPSSMSAISLDYASTDLMLLTVSFKYKEWVSAQLQIPEKKKALSILDEIFGDNPFYQGAKSAFETIGTIFDTVDEYTTRFEVAKGKIGQFKDRAEGFKGIFKGKVGKIKDLAKWL